MLHRRPRSNGEYYGKFTEWKAAAEALYPGYEYVEDDGVTFVRTHIQRPGTQDQLYGWFERNKGEDVGNGFLQEVSP